VVPLLEACRLIGNRIRQNRPKYLEQWGKKIIQHSGGQLPNSCRLQYLFDTAFEKASLRPLQVNLVGVTTNDEFVMQMAGAYPAWTAAQWPGDWRPGAIVNATNNSLILNEIGEIAGEAQGLLLELIERDGPVRPMFSPIGGEITAKNVLFIMATDRVDRVRPQLLHRCRIIRVPSLLKCQEDIPELARHRLLPRWCCLSEEAERLLAGWPYWPGNHRSLHAVLDFAAGRLACYRRVIRVSDVIRALWREDLMRIPTRLEDLVEWIRKWPELDEDRAQRTANKAERDKIGIVHKVATRFEQLPSKEWKMLRKELNRIADLTFENSSVRFKTPLRLNVPDPDKNKYDFTSTAIGLLVS
jgi:hypothetical protein